MKELMSPKEFNSMKTLSEVAFRKVAEEIVKNMNDTSYMGYSDWYVSSDGWICNRRIPEFTKTLDYHCPECGMMSGSCLCKEENQITDDEVKTDWTNKDNVNKTFGSIHPPLCPCDSIECIKKRSKYRMNLTSSE